MTVGLQNLSNQKFYDVRSIFPPSNEQDDIVVYCENVNQKVEAAIDLELQQITKLREYKSTLINAAVTGKIKVC